MPSLPSLPSPQDLLTGIVNTAAGTIAPWATLAPQIYGVLQAQGATVQQVQAYGQQIQDWARQNQPTLDGRFNFVTSEPLDTSRPIQRIGPLSSGVPGAPAAAAPAQPTQAGQAAPPGTPPDVGGPYQGPAQPTGTATSNAVAPLGPPGPNGLYTVDQITSSTDADISSARSDISQIWAQISAQQQVVTQLQGSDNPLDQAKLTPAVSNLNALYTALSSAESRLETASTARATLVQKVIDSNLLDPAQAREATDLGNKAQADAYQALTTANTLSAAAPGQRDLTAAQAAYQNALAQSTATTSKAQADLYSAQADQIQEQIKSGIYQANSDLVKAQTGTQAAQTQLLGAQATGLVPAEAAAQLGSAAASNAQAALTQARIPGETGLLGAQTGLTQAQTGLTGAQTAGNLATTQQTLENIMKGRQGALYGLQDQINVINQVASQVWGPGAAGSNADRVQQANDLLSQYVQAAIGGTTPYQAATTAGNFGLQNFATQASLADAAQAAQAARANAYMGFGGNVLGTLASLNANAPAGSTALAGAFGDVMKYMAGQMQAPQFAAPAMPTPPQLPAYLQAFGAPGGGAAAGGPLATAYQNAANTVGRAAQTMSGAGANAPTNAPVTINIGSSGISPTPNIQTPPPVPVTGQNTPGFNFGAMPGAGPQGQQSTPLPGPLQGYAPMSGNDAMDYLHQLWGPELSSGAVTSPVPGYGG